MANIKVGRMLTEGILIVAPPNRKTGLMIEKKVTSTVKIHFANICHMSVDESQ